MDDEATELLDKPDHEEFKSTNYRWVILAIFSLYSFLQSSVWDTWGPISDSATQAIGFTSHDYELLSNWGPIGIMTTMPFFIWLMNKKGMRWTMVIGGLLVALATGIRCLPLSHDARKYVIHVGQLLNGMSGCPVLGAAPLLSNIWFPPSERILATSCMLCLGNVGNAISYLIGPAIVMKPNNCTADPNITVTTPLSFTTLDHTPVSTFVSHSTACYDNTDEIRKQINLYLYGEFGLALFILLLILLCFRHKPRVSPSASASTERLDILVGLKALSRNYSYWSVTLSFALVNGAYFGWYGVVTVLLTPHNVSQTEVGNAAFVMTLTGTVAGIITGWFADRIKGQLKWILFALYCIMFIVFLYLVIMIMGWANVAPFHFTITGFWVTSIIFGSAASIMQPLGMELTADIAYPVGEGASTSIVAWFIMLAMFAFLSILNAVARNILTDQDIANYLVLVFTGIAAPVLAVSTKNRNVRLEVDMKIQEDDSVDQQNGGQGSINGNIGMHG